MSIIKNGFESADLDVPVVLPTLNLDFANSQSLDERITFSRGSIGTFVNKNGLIETAPANTPRFDYDPVTGECRGLLIEESRQNLLTYSEDFSNAAWTKLGSSVSTNVSITTAPDGSNTADKLIEDTTSGEHRFLSSSITWSGNRRYTFTLFVKAAERTRFDFLFGTAGNWSGGRAVSFDLVSGTIISTDGAIGYITKFPNNWYRCSITALTVASPTASQVVLRMINTGTNASYSGDGTSGIYIWGAQLETGAFADGSFPTSYISTSTSTVTRSLDVLDILGNNFTSWFGNTSPTELSVFYSGVSPYTYDYTNSLNLNSPFYWVLTNNDNTERIDFRYAGLPQVIPILNNASSVGGVFTIPTQVNDIKSVGLIDGKSFAIILNDGNPDYIFSKSTRLPRMPFGFSRLRIGSGATGGRPLNGTIRRLAIYPKRLSISQSVYLVQ